MLGELVLSDTAETISAKRAGALKLLARVALTSLLAGLPLAGMTDILLLYINPDISVRTIIVVLMVPVLGPLIALQATIEWYFATKIRMSSEGLLKSVMGRAKVVRWARVRGYSLQPISYVSGFSYLSLRLGFGTRCSVLVPTARATEIDKFIRRWACV